MPLRITRLAGCDDPLCLTKFELGTHTWETVGFSVEINEIGVFLIRARNQYCHSVNVEYDRSLNKTLPTRGPDDLEGSRFRVDIAFPHC